MVVDGMAIVSFGNQLSPLSTLIVESFGMAVAKSLERIAPRG